MKINKYSNTITAMNDTSGDRHYIFYNDELIAFGKDNKYYIEEKDLRKKTVIEYIENTYNYQYQNAEIVTCYNLNNMLYQN
mgnify:CR=1 FL=1